MIISACPSEHRETAQVFEEEASVKPRVDVLIGEERRVEERGDDKNTQRVVHFDT